MALDATPAPTRFLDVAARQQTAGALSADWVVFTGQTPRDIAINNAPPLVVWEPATAVSAPNAYYLPAKLASSSYWRVRASLRTMAGQVAILTIMTSGGIVWSLQVRDVAGEEGVRLYNGASNVIYSMTINGDQWYRVALERQGDRLRGYINPTPQTDIANLGSDDALTLLIDTPNNSGGISGDCYVGVNLSGTAGFAGPGTYSAVADILMEDLPAPTGASASDPQFIPLTVAPSSSPASASDPYLRYKGLRALTETFANVSLAP